MSYIPISSFVTVSIAQPPAGLKEYQVNNVAILTKDVPINGAITQTNPGIYESALIVGQDFGTNSETYQQAVAVFSQSPNILDGGGSLIIYPMQVGDTISDAITALTPIEFVGAALVAGYTPVDSEVLAGAATCEPLRVKLFASEYLASALTTTTGIFWKINSALYYHCICLLYVVGNTALAARLAAAALCGRMMSVNFSGSNTTATIHGKSLVGVVQDTGISSAILATCGTLGVQTYISVGGGGQYIGKVFAAARGGLFPDSIYNQDWLVFALQVAGFNALATTSTKLPQTEQGMAVLRGAYLAVLQQARINAYSAPGVWNSSDVFGNPDDLRRNILNVGYYIYSAPVNAQSQADRVARKAPLIQIALKESGAIHSSAVIVYVNQ